MFSHVMIGSNDLDRSQRFYDAVLGALGGQSSPMRNTTPAGHTRLFNRRPRPTDLRSASNAVRLSK